MISERNDIVGIIHLCIERIKRSPTEAYKKGAFKIIKVIPIVFEFSLLKKAGYLGGILNTFGVGSRKRPKWRHRSY